MHLFLSFRPPNCLSYGLLNQMKSDDHSINNELIIKLLWCEHAYLHFQFATTFKFTQCLCNCRNCWTLAKDYATSHCD